MQFRKIELYRRQSFCSWPYMAHTHASYVPFLSLLVGLNGVKEEIPKLAYNTIYKIMKSNKKNLMTRKMLYFLRPFIWALFEIDRASRFISSAEKGFIRVVMTG
jgi:hypothetical protein